MELSEKYALISDIKDNIELLYTQADYWTESISELSDVTPIILEALDKISEIASDYAIGVQKKYKKGDK